MDFSDLIPIFTGAIGGATSAGVFKGPIKTLEDWWFISFGQKSSIEADLLRAKHQASIEAYKSNILGEVKSIPPENLQEPTMKILGPSLEASKYYIDEEELRVLFAKLIAASMNSKKINQVHPSFVEIIKQLTPLDAQNLSCFDSFKIYPLAKILLPISKGGSREYATNIFLENPNVIDSSQMSSSIGNLSRLGLVDLDYNASRTEDEIYDAFIETDIYKLAITDMKEKNMEIDIYEKKLESFLSENRGLIDAPELEKINETKISRYQFPTIKKGVIALTPFGRDFCSVCLK